MKLKELYSKESMGGGAIFLHILFQNAVIKVVHSMRQ